MRWMPPSTGIVCCLSGAVLARAKAQGQMADTHILAIDLAKRSY